MYVVVPGIKPEAQQSFQGMKGAASPQLSCSRATSHPWSQREWKTHGADVGSKGGPWDMSPLQPPHPFPPSPSRSEGHRTAGSHPALDPICFLHPEQTRDGLQGFGVGPIPRPKGCVQWASSSIGVPSAGPISGLAGLSKPSTSPASHPYLLGTALGLILAPPGPATPASVGTAPAAAQAGPQAAWSPTPRELEG